MLLCTWLMSGRWYPDPVSYYGCSMTTSARQGGWTMAGNSSKVNLTCLMTGERIPAWGAVCKDGWQLLIVESGGKGRSLLRVAPGKNYGFPPISPTAPWPCLKRTSSVPTAVFLQTEGPGWEQPVKCALLLKRKMRLDNLPNTTSASLCTSVGEAEQQGGEDERTYQLTVWGLLSPFLPNSCRWSLAWEGLPEAPSATPVGEAQLWGPCGGVRRHCITITSDELGRG